MITYNMEQSSQLMRPIAHGSVVAVNTDDKWYRCQVVSYNSTCDTCEVKFVDHGGYSSVATNNQQVTNKTLLDTIGLSYMSHKVKLNCNKT